MKRPSLHQGLLTQPNASAQKDDKDSRGSLRSAASRDSGEQTEAEKPKVGLLDQDLTELVEKLARGGEGFSDREAERMKKGFNRFKAPGEVDIHKDDLKPLLEYLGHVMTSEGPIQEIAAKVSQFDYIDFDEFIGFMDHFIVYERDEFKKSFQKYDVDSSGTISLAELRKLTRELGFMPQRAMMREALQYVDSDNNGNLNFQEFITFLAVYRHAEGFTRPEVAELRQSFDRFSKQWQPDDTMLPVETILPPESLSDVLVAVFGLQVSEFASAFGEQLVNGSGVGGRSHHVPEDGEQPTIHFAEFLILARKVREAQRAQFGEEFAQFCGKHVKETQADPSSPDSGETVPNEQAVFQACDLDGSGGISELEIRTVLADNQYTPLKKVIDEIFDEVYEPGAIGIPNKELDFDEFFDFMLIFRQRDGFLKKDLDKLRDVFERFDQDGSGEVNIMELSEMLRHLGYRVDLDAIHDMVVQVDENGSGLVDFREFIRLMKLFREHELAKIKASFDNHRGEKERLPVESLTDLLGDIGHELPPRLAGSALINALDFDELIEITDASRDELVIRERRKAGFTDDEITQFQDLFQTFDKDRSGDIDSNELLVLLQEFGWEPRTKEEQRSLLSKLDAARNRTREAGVTDLNNDGAPELRFWTFVQLMRALRTEHDKQEEEEINKLQNELKFSEMEVEEFRQIFRTWSKRCREQEAEQSGLNQEEADSRSVIRKNARDQLSREAVRRLIRSLGCSISIQNQAQLDVKVASLDPEGRKEGAKIDFAAFLRLMRWLIDTNFAGINDAAKHA